MFPGRHPSRVPAPAHIMPVEGTASTVAICAPTEHERSRAACFPARSLAQLSDKNRHNSHRCTLGRSEVYSMSVAAAGGHVHSHAVRRNAGKDSGRGEGSARLRLKPALGQTRGERYDHQLQRLHCSSAGTAA